MEKSEPPCPLQLPPAGLALLVEVFAGARDILSEPWQFAVEIVALKRVGFTVSHLRWLLGKGFIAHGVETRLGPMSSELFDSREA